MEYRTLGDTDIQLSAIGFGVWTVSAGWWGTYTDDEAVALIRAAFDKGITFFNTGNVYGEDGRGERLVAKALGDVRDQIVIGTTFGYDESAPRATPGHSERPHDWSADNVRRSLEASLERLQTDHIDLWQLHNPRMDALANDDLWTLLDDLRSQGMVRSIGPSMGPAIGWRDEGMFALERCPIDFFHHIWNMLEQDPGNEFMDAAAHRNIGVLVRVPHSSGLLEDRYSADTQFSADDHHSHRPKEWLPEGLHKVEQLRYLLEGRDDATMGQVALKWALSDSAVTSVQPNIYELAQIEEFAAAPDIDEFDADELGDVDMLYRTNFGIVDGRIPEPLQAV